MPLTMPTLKARILAALFISAPLLILAASTQGHYNHHSRLLIRSAGRVHGEIGAKLATGPVKALIGGPKNLSISREFLVAHNKVRLHSGTPPFVWNKTLTHYARRWASKRAADCKMVHSFGTYGENIFWGGRDHWTPTDVVRLWVSEHKFYRRDTNECQAGQMCGHYMQIVWRLSVSLGCARVKCSNGGVFALCEYDPPGNYLGESPFGLPVKPLSDHPPATPSA